jgi:hypothetical protein
VHRQRAASRGGRRRSRRRAARPVRRLFDGDKTVGISDTVRVTEDGCESFFGIEPALVVRAG